MEIEQVSFDGEWLHAEGWTITDIGHGIEAFFAHARPRDVNAIFRDQFVVLAQIDGGNRVLCPVPATPAWSWSNTERTAKQYPRALYFTALNQFANARAGNRLAANSHLRIDNQLEAKLVAKFREQFYVSGRFVPEMKVVSFVDFERLQHSTERMLNELARTHDWQIARERQ